MPIPTFVPPRLLDVMIKRRCNFMRVHFGAGNIMSSVQPQTVSVQATSCPPCSHRLFRHKVYCGDESTALLLLLYCACVWVWAVVCTVWREITQRQTQQASTWKWRKYVHYKFSAVPELDMHHVTVTSFYLLLVRNAWKEGLLEWSCVSVCPSVLPKFGSLQLFDRFGLHFISTLRVFVLA
jgi:hypothetical protein